jgi:DNA-binding XRE family transcriptional regulator
MKKRKASLYPFRKDLEERLKDPEFKKEWDALEPEFQLASQLIEARIKKNISQRELAKKVKTSQAAISRIEAMNGNPSLSFLKRIAAALDSTVKISL